MRCMNVVDARRGSLETSGESVMLVARLGFSPEGPLARVSQLLAQIGPYGTISNLKDKAFNNVISESEI